MSVGACGSTGNRAPLAENRPSYQRRFGMECTYRLAKQALLWEKPRPLAPEQFERWTPIVAVSHHVLALVRPLLAARRQMGEGSKRPVTPQQGRRTMGAQILPAVRYRVVKKGQPTPKKRRKPV